MNYLLSEAAEPIREALERLVKKDEERHPFVVVEKVGNPEVFVQFAGSARRPLVFDVPLLGIYLEKTTPELGSIRAVATLATELGVDPGERVNIQEEEDEERWKGIPFWKRLFA